MKRAPAGWAVEPLASVVKTGTDVTYGIVQAGPEVGDGVPYIRTADIKNGEILLDGLRHTSPEIAAKFKRSEVSQGELVMSIRATVGTIAMVSKALDGANLTQGTARIAPGKTVNGRYLLRYIRSPACQRWIQDQVKGATSREITLTRLREMPVVVPPMKEQRRIADILDKADAIRRKRQQAIALMESFLRSAFLEMFGDPVTNPKGWPTVRLGDHAEFVGGGTPSRKRPEFFTGDICWATSKDMKGEELLDTQEHVTEEAIEKSATKLIPAGVILVVVKSKVLMHRLPVLITKVATCFGQDLKAIWPGGDLDVTYLARHMRIGQSSLLFKARGVNMEGLTLDHLRDYEVLVPPRDKVQRYATLEGKTKQALARQESAYVEAGDLFNSLVQRAFR